MNIDPKNLQQVAENFKIMRVCILYKLLPPAGALFILSAVSDAQVIAIWNNIRSFFIYKENRLIGECFLFNSVGREITVPIWLLPIIYNRF